MKKTTRKTLILELEVFLLHGGFETFEEELDFTYKKWLVLLFIKEYGL